MVIRAGALTIIKQLLNFLNLNNAPPVLKVQFLVIFEKFNSLCYKILILVLSTLNFFAKFKLRSILQISHSWTLLLNWILAYIIRLQAVSSFHHRLFLKNHRQTFENRNISNTNSTNERVGL